MRHNRKRKVNGILLLNKPLNCTSNQALTVVKRLYNANKAGHTGSLDPLATGMLPICFGEATKFSQFLLEADKEYEVEAKLGLRTETGDAEGAIIAERPVPATNIQNLDTVLAHFRGEIDQIPSMYSALKYQGQPLYVYARKGIEIERPSRKVMIYDLEILEYEDDCLRIRVRCSKGTYIRTLVDDIGEMLGCGAYVTMLHRTFVHPYSDHQMITLEELESQQEDQLDSHLLPVDTALHAWPMMTLNESMAFYMRQGQPIIIPKAPTSGLVRLAMTDGKFIGVGEVIEDGRIKPKRLVFD
jgi:tRNA pseudouridine55 synthase